MEPSGPVRICFYIYTDSVGRLTDAVRRKRPENGEPSVGFSFTTVLQHPGRDYLTKNNMKTLEHPLYSPNLSAVEHSI